MNCCDYGCNQGRNCPARVAPIKTSTPLPTPEPDDFDVSISPMLAVGMILAAVFAFVLAVFGLGVLFSHFFA